MILEKVCIAKVVDNNDPEQLGKIKIKIIPEMENFDEDLLPWIGIYKQGQGTGNETAFHEIPEVGTFIRVLIEDWPFFKRARYISDDFIEGKSQYQQFDLTIPELTEQSYPQPSFKKYKDGTIVFHNSETGEHGSYFPNGSYFLIDENGAPHIFMGNEKLSLKNNEISISQYFALYKDIIDSLFSKEFTVMVDGSPVPVLATPSAATKKAQLDLLYNSLFN